MIRWFTNMPLQKKMLISYTVLFAVSLFAFLVVFTYNLERDIETELGHMEQYNGQLGLNLDNIVEDVESFCYLHFSDDKIRSVLLSDDSDIDPVYYKETEEKLKERLALLADLEPQVLRATLVTADGRVYKNIQEDQTDYVDRMKKIAGYVDWKKGDAPYFGDLRVEKINLVSYRVISMISPIWNMIEDEPIGYVFLDLSMNKFLEQWKQTAALGQNSEFMILSRGYVLYDSGVPEGEWNNTKQTEVVKLRSLKKENGMYWIHGDTCVSAVDTHEASGWKFVQYTSFSYFSQRILRNMAPLLLILAVVILVTGIGIFVFARQVSYPVQIFSEEMGRVALSADEEQEIPLFDYEDLHTEDEVGKMIESYNAMAKRINDNIIKTYHYKLRQKQTELKMLQFQINPHFLYNALNTISAIAKLENVDYIPQIASNLSDMFRYNISNKEIVTIGEELQHTLHYMDIQMIRFPDRFEVMTDVDESLLDCKVIKFILQPVVENAYKYGFKRRGKKDIIKIKAYREGDEDVIICVEDNGAGIEMLRLEELNESFKKSERLKEQGGVGLQNVNSRLKNYYGESYHIWLESAPDCFTRVYLKIRFSKDTDGER